MHRELTCDRLTTLGRKTSRTVDFPPSRMVDFPPSRIVDFLPRRMVDFLPRRMVDFPVHFVNANASQGRAQALKHAHSMPRTQKVQT